MAQRRHQVSSSAADFRSSSQLTLCGLALSLLAEQLVSSTTDTAIAEQASMIS
jgi:hypothetical protein